MNTRKSTLIIPALAFSACLLIHTVTLAQSTLLSVPSTGVIPAKKVYVEMDFLANYAWQREGSFQTYLPRAVVGVGPGVEVGVNVSYSHISGASQPIEVQPNIKWQFHYSEEKGTAAAVGCILYAPVAHRAGANTLGQCYVVGSKRLNGNYGPRFTGGAYTVIHANDAEKTKVGAIVGYEQPFSKRTGLIVDWFSGDNRLGYVSPGLYFITSSHTSLSGGYAIANHGRGKNALFAYYGIQF